MAARSGRRYRLIRATVAVGVLFPFVLAGIGPGDEPSTATPTVPGSAESAPVPPGIAPAAVRIKLDAAAPGVTTRTGVPAEVPLVADFPGRESARVLTLTREGLDPFRAVGVTWAGAGATPVSVAVRTRTAKGPWTGWQAADRAVGSDGGTAGTRDGAELLWVGPSDAVQVTVAAADGTAPADLAVDLIDPRVAPGDTVPVPPVTTVSVDATRVARPPIHSRDEWGADERLMSWTPRYTTTVRALSWHDRPVGGDYAEADVPAILRALYYYDAVSRGWGDIGDNVVVDRFGRLWEGRYGGLSRAVVGAHTPGRNVDTAGIGVLGGASAVQEPAVEAAARYVAWKLSIGPAVDPRGDAQVPVSTPAGPDPAAARGQAGSPPPGADDKAAADPAAANPAGNPPAVNPPAANPAGNPAAVNPAAGPAPAVQPAPGGAPAHANGAGHAQPPGARTEATQAPYGKRPAATKPPAPVIVKTPAKPKPVAPTAVPPKPTPVATPAPAKAAARVAPKPTAKKTKPKKTRAKPRRAKRVAPKAPAPATVTVPRVFAADRSAPAADLATVRDRAYTLMGSWSRPETMRRTLATWTPATATFAALGDTTPIGTGSPGDVPVPADYDGDGQRDPATWSPATATWTIHNSSGGTTERIEVGRPDDKPVPADYDGDGRADPATWTPKTATWHVRGLPDQTFGRPGDQPVPADYTGDGRADLAVYRSGRWEIQGAPPVELGGAWHVPVPADYDGDGRADPATWSTRSHRWYVRGQAPVTYGTRGDVPVPGQYDGDGRADFALWRPPAGAGAGGTWLIRDVGTYPVGTLGDIPAMLG